MGAEEVAVKHWEWVEFKYGDKRSAAEKREGNKLLRRLAKLKAERDAKAKAEAEKDAEKVLKFPHSSR